MSYCAATDYLITEFECKPEVLELDPELSDSPFIAMRNITRAVAPNFIRPEEPIRSGQFAQGLSDWHRELAEQCGDRYRALASETMSKDEANADERLQTLQAIRRGVGTAMRSYYRQARSTGILTSDYRQSALGPPDSDT